ncbi:MAG: signal peptidase II [Lachnospiraceae bacterium]|nr:signal peptidase II [Lachnospiraceae bacterium]
MFHSRKSYFIAGLFVTILGFLLDRVSKVFAMGLQGQTDIILIPGVLQFHYLENTGAAFSLLNGQFGFFFIVTPILCLLILFLLSKLPYDNKRYFPLWLIGFLMLAGALGNFVDRIVYRYVIDFIYFSLINFPVFNVADIYVTCGLIVFLILYIFYYKDGELDAFYRKKEQP